MAEDSNDDIAVVMDCEIAVKGDKSFEINESGCERAIDSGDGNEFDNDSSVGASA